MNADEKLPPGETFRMEVVGEAAPGGSKTARPVFKNGQPLMKNGKPVIAMRPANKKTKPWMNLVAESAVHEWGPRGMWLLDGPLFARITFYVPRPDNHYSTKLGPEGRRILKPSAPLYPHKTNASDLDKVARSTLDALQGIIFTNDRRFVDLQPRRVYGDTHYCVIEIMRPLHATVGELRDDLPPGTPVRGEERPAPVEQVALPV